MAEDDTLENLVRRLTALVVKLDERNERLDDWIGGQADINERLTGAIERIDRTLAQVAMTRRTCNDCSIASSPPARTAGRSEQERTRHAGLHRLCCSAPVWCGSSNLTARHPSRPVTPRRPALPQP